MTSIANGRIWNELGRGHIAGFDGCALSHPQLAKDAQSYFRRLAKKELHSMTEGDQSGPRCFTGPKCQWRTRSS